MRKKALIHSLILTLGTAIIFFWTTDNELNYYSLQLTSVLLLTLFISHRILKPTSYKLAESTISTMAVLLISTSTGGVSSPLFFLNYLLLFELSFLLEPVIPLILSLLLIMFYFFYQAGQPSILLYIELLAFPFMTPLAVWTGKMYQKVQNQKKEINNLSSKMEELKEELIEEEISRDIDKK